MDNSAIITREILRFKNGVLESVHDVLIRESPLRIVIYYFRQGLLQQSTFAIVMRTPGEDVHLAVGMIFNEGMISDITDIVDIAFDEDLQQVKIVLSQKLNFPDGLPARTSLVNSSCGLCSVNSEVSLNRESIYLSWSMQKKASTDNLIGILRHFNQGVSIFKRTGGNHMVSLYNLDGQALYTSEDVGRHNALDKVIGKALKDKCFPFDNHVLMLSSRVGYEMAQKAMMAGTGILIGMGAPSDSAVSLAEDVGMTLIGFMSEHKFNLYAGRHRIHVAE